MPASTTGRLCVGYHARSGASTHRDLSCGIDRARARPPQVACPRSLAPEERATFLSSWRDKKLRGVILGASGTAGNAATRIEALATKSGLYAYGVVPEVEDLFQRQARELDRKKREELLHQAQKILHDRVVFAPIWENGFIRGIGPRVEEAGLTLIQAFPYSAPCEDLRLKKP